MNPIQLTNQHASNFTVHFPLNNSNTIGQTSSPHANSQTNAVEDNFVPLSFTPDLESQPHSSNTTDSGFQRIQRIRNLKQRITLYRIALEGDWEAIESILSNNNNRLLSASITRDKETALHIAAGAKHIGFVEALMEMISKEEVAKKNRHGNTALCFAAASGVVRIAELMVKKNKGLPLIRGFGSVTPLFMAVSYKCKPMASYLLSVTPLTELTSQERIELLIATIHSDFFDISLKILADDPTLATTYDAKNNNETALHVMARKPSAIHSGDRPSFWKSCTTLKRISKKEETMKVLARQFVELLWKHVVYELPQKQMLSFIRHPSRLLHDAASEGNVEFLVLLIRRYPDIVWEEDEDGKSIFHVAVEHRLEDVFNLIYEIGGLKDFSTKYRTTVKGKYNILHLAAKLAAPNHLNRVSGAALQMQRELLWYKEVEKIVLPSQLEAKCDDPLKLTPRELFTKEHKDLRKDGEAWMRNTTNSCMVVSTLIATVIFAAAFTIPGGDDHEGTPIFQKRFWFTIFVISDAIALISSTSSILVFLSILTSRYAEDDFLHSLPSRLLIGFTSLFVSIVCMVVAFSATFFIHYHNNANIWVPTIVATTTIVPVCCFCVLQFKLWVDIYYNTYLSKYLFRPRQRKLSSSPLTLPLPKAIACSEANSASY